MQLSPQSGMFKFLIALSLVGLVAASDLTVGSSSVCQNGQRYLVTHQLRMTPNLTTVNLDTFPGLESVTCDFDQTSLLLTFPDASHATAFVNAVDGQAQQTFVTSVFSSCIGGEQNIRRVISAVQSGASVELHAVIAKYDELIEEGTISMASAGACNGDQHFCVGVNVNADCTIAAKPIPLYSNKFVDLECTNCYAAFMGDVFLTLDIKHFKLQSVSAGFKNLEADLSLIMDLKGSAQWSAGYDKVFPIVPSTTVISFRVADLPFKVTFEVPLEVKASATFYATAEATGGVTAKWMFGDMYASWNAGSGWSHVTPRPQLSWTPQLQTTQPTFSSEFSLSVVPTVTMRLNDVFTYSMTAIPNADLKVAGDLGTKTVCANSTVSLDLHSHSELHFDVDWLHIHDDKTWDKDIYSSGNVDLEEKCIHI
jgi:hypothetical protein